MGDDEPAFERLFSDGPPPTNVEAAVLEALTMGILAQQVWEAERDEDEPAPPEGQMVLRSSIAMLRTQGTVVANLALSPETRAELKERMANAIEYVPAWMEAKVFGVEVMTARLYACGMCQVLREHRAAIEQVIEEQVNDREPLERLLEEAPLPELADDEAGPEILQANSEALGAHMQVLVDIAHEIDQTLS